MPVALVSTVRDDAQIITAFVQHHLQIGIQRIYLFLDGDCRLPPGTFADQPEVTVFAADSRRWRGTKLSLLPHVDREVMARQALNAETALELASDERFEWLVHLDCDELLYSTTPIPELFASLADSAVEVVSFHNLEAVPETEQCGNVFEELTLFKRGEGLQREGTYDAAQRALLASMSGDRDHFFVSYTNGKSAARVGRGLLPDLVHTFYHPSRNVCRLVGDALVLHFPVASFQRFLQKYRYLGRFDDRWFGAMPIREHVGAFHLDARDVVATGDIELALEFYRRRVMLDDPDVIARFIRAGLLCRIPPDQRRATAPNAYSLTPASGSPDGEGPLATGGS